MGGGYTYEQKAEIERSFRIIRAALSDLHERLGDEFDRSLAIVTEEVRERTLARVLVVGELMRGILRDERRPVSSAGLVISPRMRHAFGIAHAIGKGMAPLAVTETPLGFNRLFVKKLPRFSSQAKEAIMRCEMAHASSKNAARVLAMAGLSQAEPIEAVRLGSAR